MDLDTVTKNCLQGKDRTIFRLELDFWSFWIWIGFSSVLDFNLWFFGCWKSFFFGNWIFLDYFLRTGFKKEEVD